MRVPMSVSILYAISRLSNWEAKHIFGCQILVDFDEPQGEKIHVSLWT